MLICKHAGFMPPVTYASFFLVCSLVQGAAAFDGMVRTELFSIFKCQTSICESKNSVLCRKTWLKLYILFKAAFN